MLHMVDPQSLMNMPMQQKHRYDPKVERYARFAILEVFGPILANAKPFTHHNSRNTT